MSEEYLMTGSFGLDVDDWQGNFYDDDLPAGWRAAYYSTLLRSVLLPQQEWQQAIEDNITDEVDEDFRFVLYLEPDADEQGSPLAALSALPAKFASQVAGVVLACAPAHLQTEVAKTVHEIRQMFPLCLDTGVVDYAESGVDVFCEDVDVAAVWYPSAQAEPLPSGDFLVTLIDQQSLQEQRKIMEVLGQWMSGRRGAALFNTSSKDAPLRAQESRVLAELMGV